MRSSGAKVAWDDVCKPKEEGGLGIKRIKDCNLAMMMRYIWLLFTDKQNLWVLWVHTYHLRGRSFWRIKASQTCSWNWLCLLKLRSSTRLLIKHVIGNGQATKLWYDNWHPMGPLDLCVGLNGLNNSLFNLEEPVSSVINNDLWQWPPSSNPPHGVATSMPTYLPNSALEDSVKWIPNGRMGFSSYSAWDLIRPRNPPVCWYKLVWSNSAIPKMSFILWLAVRNRLITLDRMQSFAAHLGVGCILCRTSPESHSHLFFACPYSSRVWSATLSFAGELWQPMPWNDFVAWAALNWKGKSMKFLICRLCLAATVYHLWMERNNRKFRNQFKDPTSVTHLILQTVWCRLASLNFKSSYRNLHTIQHWRLPPRCLI